ncbi:hypothetical protein SmJEL517_g05123 [Synchytrium microbalum]|uniref:V-type proton ATPase subunit S1/VOA1 transmembrane domain-containing protein n=1 Tax=Synchytrium microbalum TaxID=1806994 RepID=A0A507BWS0_9FUNG|nr:uncharacterized protein SmJEL517_g05123 [Synchytrium microbalum]TPX31598.1 hypothetical protein SmJEL517_g05123 [Synchytrium microbalum]
MAKSAFRDIQRNEIIYDSLDSLPCHDLTVVMSVSQLSKMSFADNETTALYIPYTSGDLVTIVQGQCGLSTSSQSLDSQTWDLPQQTNNLILLNSNTAISESDMTNLLARLDSISKDYVLYMTGPTRPVFRQATTPWSKLPVAQKYVFFTTGTFHGIAVLIVLVGFLLIAYSILSSIESPTKFPTPESKRSS